MRAVSAGVALFARSALQTRACTFTWSLASRLESELLPSREMRVLEVTVIVTGWGAFTKACPCGFADLTLTCSPNGSVGPAPGAVATVPCSTTMICGLQPTPVVGGLEPLPGCVVGGAATAADALNAAAVRASKNT